MLRRPMLLAVLAAALGAAQPAAATIAPTPIPAGADQVIDFDTTWSTAAAATLDGVAGASGTGWALEWRWPLEFNGYLALGANGTANSIGLKDGPKTLVSFTISATRDWLVCDRGEALPFSVALYDGSGALLQDRAYETRADGVWRTLQFDVAGVALIKIGARDTVPHEFDGWRLRIDDIALADWTAGPETPVTVPPADIAVSNVPLPAALPLGAAAFAALGLVSLRRRRDEE